MRENKWVKFKEDNENVSFKEWSVTENKCYLVIRESFNNTGGITYIINVDDGIESEFCFEYLEEVSEFEEDKVDEKECELKIGDKIKLVKGGYKNITNEKSYEIVDFDDDEDPIVIDDRNKQHGLFSDSVEIVKEKTFPRMMLVKDYEHHSWNEVKIHAIVETLAYSYIYDDGCNGGGYKYGKEIEEIKQIRLVSQSEAKEIIEEKLGCEVEIIN